MSIRWIKEWISPGGPGGNAAGGVSPEKSDSKVTQNYTCSLMTGVFWRVIVDSKKIRTTDPERKGNAADTYVQFKKCISPV